MEITVGDANGIHALIDRCKLKSALDQIVNGIYLQDRQAPYRRGIQIMKATTRGFVPVRVNSHLIWDQIIS